MFAGLCLEGAGILLMFAGARSKVSCMGKNCDDFFAFTTCKFRRTLRLKWHSGCGGRDVMQLNAERATVGRKGQIPHLWENPDFVESRSTQKDERLKFLRIQGRY